MRERRGGRPERPINPDSPSAALATKLRKVRYESGIGYRELARRTNYSTTYLSDAARGKPTTLDVVLAFVRGCQGPLTETETAEWTRLWTEARERRAHE